MTRRILVFAAAITLAPAAPVSADVPIAAIQAGVEAGSGLADYVVELETAEKRLPKLTDPRGAILMNRLFDAGAVMAGRPQGPEGFADLSQWNDVAHAVFRRYASLQDTPGDPGQAERNAATYQDELTLALVFMLRSIGAMTQSLEARFESAEDPEGRIRSEGRRLMEGGISEVVQGALALVSIPGIRPENARALTGAIAEEMPVYAAALSPEAGLLFRRLAEGASTKTSDPETSENLRRIVWAPVAETIELLSPVVAADRASWSRAMAEAIRSRVRYPAGLLAADQGAPPSGRTMVALTIDRLGAVLAADIAASSGDRRLDEAALAVVRETAPYPAPPADVAGDQVNVTVPINFVAEQAQSEPRSEPQPQNAPEPAAASPTPQKPRAPAPKPAAQAPKPAAQAAKPPAAQAPKPPPVAAKPASPPPTPPAPPAQAPAAAPPAAPAPPVSAAPQAPRPRPTTGGRP